MVSVGGFALLALLGGTAGCGGGNGGGSTAGNGTSTGTRAAGHVKIHIVWPAPIPTRLIPVLSNSIRIVITDSGQTLAEQVVRRPTDGSNISDVAFDSLSPGDVVVIATAYPNSDGTGTAQAAGSVPVTVVSDQVVPASVTMGTTIDHLELNGSAPLYAYTGRTSNAYTVTARDASGNVVLFPSGGVTWADDGGGVISVAASGQVTGNTVGTGNITVTDSESGKSSTLPVTVRPSGKYLIATGYTVQEIPLPAADAKTATIYASEGFGVNESGQVVGVYSVNNGSQRSFFWDGTATQEIVVPGVTSSRTMGINNRGQAAGFAQISGGLIENFVWSAASGTIVIPIYQPVTSQGQRAYGIGESGLVVGDATILPLSTGMGWPVSATGTVGNPSALSTTSVFFPGRASQCINASDAIAGYITPTSTTYTAAIEQNAMTTQLPALTSVSSNAAAAAINDDGVAVGYGGYPFVASFSTAVRWPNSTTVTSLGKLSGWSSSAALGINNGGLIVGECGNITTNLSFMYSFPARAFIYGRATPDSSEAMVDITALLPSASGYTMMHAGAINDSGQIVGIAVRGSQYHAVLLTPK